MFNNKVLLITGGTGSFGNAVLRRFLDSDISEIRIFSRDERKQDDMRKRYGTIGAAAGSIFVFKGKYRAVLIQYPARQEKDLIC